MEKCSHEGHKMGAAVSHLKKMHKEHGHTDHARAHGAENENREKRGMERSMERDQRKDG